MITLTAACSCPSPAAALAANCKTHETSASSSAI